MSFIFIFIPFCYCVPYSYICLYKHVSLFISFTYPFQYALLLASVTRFGEIWQYFESLWAISKGLNYYLAKIFAIFGKLLCFWVNFHCYKWPNIEK